MTHQPAYQVSENASKLKAKTQRRKSKRQGKIAMHPNPPNAYASMRQSMVDVCSKPSNQYTVIPFPSSNLISSKAKSHGLMGITARRCK
jgi:hypothetical protein